MNEENTDEEDKEMNEYLESIGSGDDIG